MQCVPSFIADQRVQIARRSALSSQTTAEVEATGPLGAVVVCDDVSFAQRVVARSW